MTANAINFRRALLAYRDGARLHAGTRPQEPQFAIIEAKVALLCRAGFTPEHAVNLLFAVGRFVSGLGAGRAANAARRCAERSRSPALPAAVWRLGKAAGQGADALFEAGLRLLVDGAEAALANANNHG